MLRRYGPYGYFPPDIRQRLRLLWVAGELDDDEFLGLMRLL